MPEAAQLPEQEPDLKNLAKARMTEGELLREGAQFVIPSPAEIGEGETRKTVQLPPRLEVTATQRARAKKEMEVDLLYEHLKKVFNDAEIGLIQRALNEEMAEEIKRSKGQSTDVSKALKAILDKFDPNIFEVPK